MEQKKLSVELIKKLFEEASKENLPTKDELIGQLENFPKSEFFGITTYYLVSLMQAECPNILDLAKTKVEETFAAAKGSRFDFLHGFSKMVLLMSPIMPSFDKNSNYVGFGYRSTLSRVDAETVRACIHGHTLSKRREGFAFNGVLSHELAEQQYLEQNESFFEQFSRKDWIIAFRIIKEIAVDERVYAIDPKYCREMKQFIFERYFKSERNPWPLGRGRIL